MDILWNPWRYQYIADVTEPTGRMCFLPRWRAATTKKP